MEPLSRTYDSASSDTNVIERDLSGKKWAGPLLILLFLIIFYFLERMTGPLQWVHWLFISAVGGLYFLSSPTRSLVVIGLPVIAYATIYDFFQFIPFESLLPIQIQSIYQWDLKLFGVGTAGNPLLFHEWLFSVFSHPLWDFASGVFYTLHIPVVIVLILYFWWTRSISLAQKFTLAFFLINIFAFATYFLLPAAAPWYVEKFGFIQPTGPIPGDAAGLIRFEQLLGIKFFSENYQISPVVFGAIPSMHAGFATLGWLFSFQAGRRSTYLLTLYILGMYISALYLQHHYLLDVIWGIAYALLAWVLIDKIFIKAITKLNRTLWSLFFTQAGGPLIK